MSNDHDSGNVVFKGENPPFSFWGSRGTLPGAGQCLVYTVTAGGPVLVES